MSIKAFKLNARRLLPNLRRWASHTRCTFSSLLRNEINPYWFARCHIMRQTVRWIFQKVTLQTCFCGLFLAILNKNRSHQSVDTLLYNIVLLVMTNPSRHLLNAFFFLFLARSLTLCERCKECVSLPRHDDISLIIPRWSYIVFNKFKRISSALLLTNNRLYYLRGSFHLMSSCEWQVKKHS